MCSLVSLHVEKRRTYVVSLLDDTSARQQEELLSTTMAAQYLLQRKGKVLDLRKLFVDFVFKVYHGIFSIKLELDIIQHNLHNKVHHCLLISITSFLSFDGRKKEKPRKSPGFFVSFRFRSLLMGFNQDSTRWGTK